MSHPTYPDGTPILVGDRATQTAHGPGVVVSVSSQDMLFRTRGGGVHSLEYGDHGTIHGLTRDTHVTLQLGELRLTEEQLKELSTTHHGSGTSVLDMLRDHAVGAAKKHLGDSE